ncbi:hypothetical protein [Pseudomonas sp. G(2018)]|uniref:hypothetical protein n=1 Tax=Pseudomonas sp. G(2018) TaxID=2502242 RepID=UPI0010F6D3E0|nr:hypothetical protein [Pseudomonas sp. G(2018)]
MRLSAIRSLVQLSGLLLSLSLLNGCANLEEIRDFSNQSAAITASTQALNYEQTWEARKKNLINVAQSYPLCKKVENVCVQYIDIPKADVQTLSEDEKKAIESVQSVLSKYMVQLAALAGDDVVSVDKNVDELVKDLNGFPGSAEDKESREKRNAAYGAIVKLVKLPLEGWRQYKLKQLIIENDADIQLLVDLLSEQTKNTANRILTEELETNQWYGRIVQAYPANNFIDAFGNIQSRKDRLAESNAKTNAAFAASDAIKKFGTVHHEMAMNLSSFNSRSMKDLIANVKAAKEDVEKARKQYQAAFAD